MNKFILAAILGLLLTCGGGYLRLHVKSLSMHSTGTFPAVDSSGKTVGSATWSQEDASQTAALTDIALVLLYVGSALCVAAAAAWLFVPARKMDHEKSVA
jgi:hypothetical protein